MAVWGDIVFINLTIVVSYLLRFTGRLPAYNWHAYLVLAPWITGTMLVAMASLGLFEGRWYGTRDLRQRTFLGVALFSGLSLVASFLMGNLGFPRSVFLLSSLFDFPVVYLWHRMVQQWQYPPGSTLVLQFSMTGNQGPAIPLGEFGDRPQFREYPMGALRAAEWEQGDVVLIGDGVDAAGREAILLESLQHRLLCIWKPTIYEGLVALGKISAFAGRPALQVEPIHAPVMRRYGKRIGDIVLASLLSLVALPFAIFIGIGIVLDSGRPIFYKQERVTEGRRTFCLWKFRTLVSDYEERYGIGLTLPDHPGVTRFGGFLRTTHLDEIPQLYNVLKGDMSLVGPRPERPVYVDSFQAENAAYALRHNVKAGITGLAQVNGQYLSSYDEKLQMDLAYARRHNLWEDLRLIIQTLQAIVFPRPPKPPSQAG